jgi:hypothetical protein
VQVGNSYRAAAVRARGRRCFDHNHYSKNNMDVRYAGVGQGEFSLCSLACIVFPRGGHTK